MRFVVNLLSFFSSSNCSCSDGISPEGKLTETMNITSVTIVGDFLHFGQLFKAFCNNEFAQISYIIRQFL